MRAMIVIVIFLAVTVVLAGQEISSTGLTIQDLRNGLKDPSRWVMYSGDYTSRRHSPLTQITPANVNRLIAQWTFQTDLSAFMSTGRPGGLQSVPLVIDGVLYFAGISQQRLCDRRAHRKTNLEISARHAGRRAGPYNTRGDTRPRWTGK